MKKKGFFEIFFSEFSYEGWIAVFDWLFDDGKFEGWKSYELGNYVKEYKKHDAIKNGMYVCGKRSEVTPEDYNRKKCKTKNSIVIMIKGSGEGKDLIRHIRNGIAHGRATLCTRKGTRCLELIDYGKFGEKSEKGSQTASLLCCLKRQIVYRECSWLGI